jgi:hypothetical protein
MADRVRRVSYCHVMVPNRPGQGAKVLEAVRQAGVNLLALSAFPAAGGRAQLDLMAENLGTVRRALARTGLRVSATRRGFLVQGGDQVGAVHRHVQKLAERKINVTALDAVTAGKGRYGMILWVKPRDYGAAARALGAR